jgi:hypothetical protein
VNCSEVKFVYSTQPHLDVCCARHDQPFLSLACCCYRPYAGSTALLLLRLGKGRHLRHAPARHLRELLRMLPGVQRDRKKVAGSAFPLARNSVLLHLPRARTDRHQASQGWECRDAGVVAPSLSASTSDSSRGFARLRTRLRFTLASHRSLRLAVLSKLRSSTLCS